MMKKTIPVLLILVAVIAGIFLFRCNDKSGKGSATTKSKHHLNIPENGIQSMMEANTQKFIEGTDGTVIITVGEVTRKKADITIKRDNRILDEKIIEENESMTFDYEGTIYTIELKNIKKPLIGAGKAEISIR